MSSPSTVILCLFACCMDGCMCARANVYMFIRTYCTCTYNRCGLQLFGTHTRQGLDVIMATAKTAFVCCARGWPGFMVPLIHWHIYACSHARTPATPATHQWYPVWVSFSSSPALQPLAPPLPTRSLLLTLACACHVGRLARYPVARSRFPCQPCTYAQPVPSPRAHRKDIYPYVCTYVCISVCVHACIN